MSEANIDMPIERLRRAVVNPRKKFSISIEQMSGGFLVISKYDKKRFCKNFTEIVNAVNESLREYFKSEEIKEGESI